jgi:hypothetical protein
LAAFHRRNIAALIGGGNAPAVLASPLLTNFVSAKLAFQPASQLTVRDFDIIKCSNIGTRGSFWNT